jgi:hypothetical protein
MLQLAKAHGFHVDSSQDRVVRVSQELDAGGPQSPGG